MKMEYTPSICPYCGCGCGLNLVSVNGKIEGVEPWPRHPINHGKLCPKGNFCHEFIHHPERLTQPLIKINGKFHQASWDEALNKISSEIKKIKNIDPDAMAFLASARCTNEENYILQKFGRLIIGTNNIDNCADLCHGPSVAGLSLTVGSGAMTNSIDDLEDSQCIFIIGSNTLEQHPLIGRRILRAKENGTTIIVADPRNTITAQKAHIYLPLKPGTDIPLINSLMKVILDEGLEDLEFINNRTRNFEKLKEVLVDYSPEFAQRITGIPAKEIIKAAICYGESDRASIVYSMGITQHKHGTDNVKSLANLALLTGNLGKRGTGINPLRGQNNVQGACDMGTLPLFYPGYQKIVLDNVRNTMESKWHCNSLSGIPGLQSVEIMDAIYDESIKGLYIMGENPMLSDPDIQHVKKSLEKLELLVVQDIFMTETAEMADFILPSASWAEKSGTFTNTERRVQTIRKAVNPPGNAKEDWVIIRELARIMGSEHFNYQSAPEIFDEIRKVTPQYSGMTKQKLKRPEGVQWPCTSENHPGTRVMHREEFPTNDGKGVFIPVNYKSRSESLKMEYPFILTTGRVIFHYQTGTMTRRSKTLENQSNEPYVEINTEDAYDLNIKNQELLKIITPHGEIDLKAKVTPHILSGVIFIPFHFTERGANILTSGELLDPVSKMPEFKVSEAKIVKIG